jgi:lipopolysaccharide transport system permease protein
MKEITEVKEIIIRAKPKWLLLDIRELWRCRELFVILAWRDIKIRYKQTVIGIAWVLFQPLVNMAIFSYFFGKVANIPSGNLPYPLFVLCGLVFWTFFANAINNASNSLIVNEDIIKKVYFPKIVSPLASVLTAILDFSINLPLLFAAIVIFGKTPSLSALFIIPLAIIITIITVSGIGTFCAAINVKYRDVRIILPFFMQILLFVTPVIYPTSMLKKEHLYIIALNPMTGVIDSVRAVISGSSAINYELLGIGCISSLVILFCGLYYFNKTERFFADII